MGKDKWSGRSRFRQIGWIVLAIFVLVLVITHRPGTTQMRHAFSAFGLPGYVVHKAQVASLRQGASYLHVFPQLGGLPLSEAMTHPNGLAGNSSFIEILYGTASGNYLDLAQSDIALEMGGKGTVRTVSGLAVREGVAKLGGKERRFAAGKLGKAYFMLVGPVDGSNFTAALQQIAAAR